jgi:hypothetical protein
MRKGTLSDCQQTSRSQARKCKCNAPTPLRRCFSTSTRKICCAWHAVVSIYRGSSTQMLSRLSGKLMSCTPYRCCPHPQPRNSSAVAQGLYPLSSTCRRKHCQSYLSSPTMQVASQLSKESTPAEADHWKRLYLSSRRLDTVHWSRPLSRLFQKQLVQQPRAAAGPPILHAAAASLQRLRSMHQSEVHAVDLARCYHTVTPLGEELLMLAGGLLRDGCSRSTLDVVLVKLQSMCCCRPALYGVEPCARYHHTATPIAVARASRLEQEVSTAGVRQLMRCHSWTLSMCVVL